jgi:hypothetical protein
MVISTSSTFGILIGLIMSYLQIGLSVLPMCFDCLVFLSGNSSRTNGSDDFTSPIGKFLPCTTFTTKYPSIGPFPLIKTFFYNCSI